MQILLPDSCRLRDVARARELDGASVIGYADEFALASTFTCNGHDVRIVNGRLASAVSWHAVKTGERRRHCDVLVLSVPDDASDEHYPESVCVDATGQVISIRRHYPDSPVSVDLRSGRAVGLICAGSSAGAIVTHLAAHGWGLDSIGGLTRRFHVEWSDTPSALGRQALGEPAAVPDRNGAPPRKNGNELSRHLSAAPPKLEPEASLHHRASPRRNGPGAAVLHSQPRPGASTAYRFAKRFGDIVLSSAALLVLFPVLLVVAVMIKVTSKGPVLFGHVRQGLGGREFKCLKFRTMVTGAQAIQNELRNENEVDGPQFKIARDPRLTRVGGWLRRFNIDEVPQFVNVLLGDMSLVGPRPSPDDENQFCPVWRRVRLSVRPGITGLWQVLRLRSQSDSDFQEWIYYDLEYVTHRSLWLDWQLLWHTPHAIFASRKLGKFAAKLQRRGMCVHSARIPRSGPRECDRARRSEGRR